MMAAGGQPPLGPVEPVRGLPFPAGLGESHQVHGAGLMIERDRTVGEDHRRVGVPRAVRVCAACLGLELVAEVTHPAEREAERQRRYLRPVHLQVSAEPIEERSVVNPAPVAAGLGDDEAIRVRGDGARERASSVAHEREPPGTANAGVEPERVP